jgi:hypothetical protein
VGAVEEYGPYVDCEMPAGPKHLPTLVPDPAEQIEVFAPVVAVLADPVVRSFATLMRPIRDRVVIRR